ncbi:MAG: cytochrome b/b6 domain-containing protein [Burkholderiales bacterium]|nr:cytochrome b/b6 domain-containing protein [Burkholderiales bacterium]
MTERVLVWDLPTRVFHWLLAAAFAGAWLTGDSERWRDLHMMLGYSVAGLIVFRILWGFVGSRYARFRSFLFRPAELLAYLRSLATRSPRHYLGHNPAGSIAVFLLLGLGLVTALSGYAYFQEWGGEWLEEVHEAAAVAMLAVVGMHIAGVIASSLLHRENLVRAMITGRKLGESGQGIARRYGAVALLLLAAGTALWAWYPAGGEATGQVRAVQQEQRHDDERG